MSLPPGFTDPEDYFGACLSFFDHYRDLCCRSNVDILTDNLDFHIPLTELDSVDDLSSQGACAEEFCGNNYSNAFFEAVSQLTPVYEKFKGEDSEKSPVRSPMSRKKAHEVLHLTEEIKNMCQVADVQTVVDLGAGLGYINYQIFLETGYNILSLESQESLYANAKEHQRKNHSDSLGKIKFIHHVVSEDSDTSIDSFLKDKFPNEEKGFCMMGLHACGDLTVSAIKLFIKMEDSRGLVVTPCCYHKMELLPDQRGRFYNFPLSDTLKKIYEKFEAYKFLNIPFLRIATQPGEMKNEDMEERVFFLLARAILKVYAKKHNCTLLKVKRNTGQIPKNDFAKYVDESVGKGYRLVAANDPQLSKLNNLGVGRLKSLENEIMFDRAELMSMWENMPKTTFADAALYITYQNRLAYVVENFILYDRLVYLMESGIECCHYKKVLDETISPKCLSLFACKT